MPEDIVGIVLDIVLLLMLSYIMVAGVDVEAAFGMVGKGVIAAAAAA